VGGHVGSCRVALCLALLPAHQPLHVLQRHHVPTSCRGGKYIMVLESGSMHLPLAAGVYGRVTELANATSKKYNIALAVLLARDMDSVVVKDEAVAKDCIQLLKDRKAPPMTFYPLNSVKVRQQWHCSPSNSCCMPHPVTLKPWTSCRHES
jgi:SMC proteins Flexible Hinge Domain